MGELRKGTEDDYDSKIYKNYKKYKKFREKISEEQNNRPNVYHDDGKYFSCLYCNKINFVKDVVNEESENRTLRARYITWKKFKGLSSELGGSLENGLNYLLSLHENMTGDNRNDHEIGIAGFGGGDKK